MGKNRYVREHAGPDEQELSKKEDKSLLLSLSEWDKGS